MPENWDNISTICAGRLLKGRMAIGAVTPDLFVEPYDRLVQLLKEGNRKPDEIMQVVGAYPYQAAVEAYEKTKDLDGTDWIAVLEECAAREQLADELENQARKLRRGDQVEFVQVEERFKALSRRQPYMTPLTEVKDEETFFVSSGWEAIDQHVGGWPKIGLVTIGAPGGTGKTTFLIKAAYSFLKKHNCKVAIFTLEMSAIEFKKRVKELCPGITDREMGMIVVEEGIMPVDKVCSRAMREPNIGFVGVDFADLMIADENNESEMAKIYRNLAILAKTLQIPVMLLSQLSKAYPGGVPIPRYLRYTSLADALSWMILMPYNPAKDFTTKNPDLSLPNVPGISYVAVWKVRGGYILHPDDNPGAIAIPWNGYRGWGDQAAPGNPWRKLTFT